MSSTDRFVIVPLAILADRRLTHRQRVVLEALMSFRAARSGHVFPALSDIGTRCGLHPHAVSTAVNDLARAGYITIKRHRGPSDYQFCFDFHDWAYQPENGPGRGQESMDQEATESGESRVLDFPESVTSKTIETSRNPGSLDFPESELRLPGIRELDFPESGNSLQTSNRPTTEAPLPPTGESDAHSTSEASPQTDNPQTSAPTARPKRKTAELPPESFAAFWSAYPRKVAKGAAERVFAKIAPDAELLARMLAAVAAMERSYRADRTHWRDGVLDLSYLPHPATWLNARRWEDEAPAAGPVPEPDNRPPCHRPFPPDALDLPVCTPEEAMRHADRAAALMRAAVREAEAKRNLARGRR